MSNNRVREGKGRRRGKNIKIITTVGICIEGLIVRVR